MVAAPPPADALQAWSTTIGREPRVTPITTGLINLTFRVETEAGRRYALQRLAPIFGREVHVDIEAVTAHLEGHGVLTPRLVRTANDALDVQLTEDGSVWRLMTWIDGVCHTRLVDPRLGGAAGQLLGRFHAALTDFEVPFRHARLGVHDTPRHLQGLRAALDAGRVHPDHAVIAPLGEAILRAAERLPPLPDLPRRVVHGDPKVSNLVFTAEGHGRALIDLDTLARMPLPLELGDALRSWCNPNGEDAQSARFDLEIFEAAITGYAEQAHQAIDLAERDALVTGTRTIMVELAARFCRDAFEDRYFGWDPERFPTRSAHNRVRAERQLALAQDLEQRAAEAERIARRAFH